MNETSADPLIIANLIARHAVEQPDLDVLTFVEVLDDGSFADQSRSYAELWHNGQCVAHALDAEDMQLGDAFAVVMQNHPEFVDTMVGSSIAGTVFVPIDPRTRGQKLAFMINHADCRGVVVGDYAYVNIVEITSECPQLEWIWVVRGGTAYSTEGAGLRARDFSAVLGAASGPDIAVRVHDANAAMQMLYTSGTTGDPKAILSPYARFGFVASLAETLGLMAGDRPYSGLSLTHANAQLITLGTTLYMGLRGVFSRKFTKSRMWDITRQYGCTTFNLLGGMTTAIYSEPLLDNDADNPVRFVLSAGMPAAIWPEFGKRFDLDIYEFYGAAEGGLTLNPPASGPIGSIGKPPPGMIGRVVDEQDCEVEAGEPGEIVFRNEDGSCPVISYFKNPEASADKTANGWLRMGDIGYRDDAGWFYFLYRKGGGIRHNGDFVNPAFVEKELAEHPQVDDVFVYGVASANGVPGEKDVVAAIVPRDQRGFDSADVFRWCRAKLESSFVPTYLQIVSEIPKTASEKPQERFLLEAFAPDADNVVTEQ